MNPKQLSEQIEILYDDLEYTSKGIFLYEGKPFTGLAYEDYRNGNRRCVIPFIDGREHGVAQGFSQDGKLKQETPYNRGKKHGTEREWFGNGQLSEESVIEYGVLMKSTEWGPDGSLRKEYVRSPSDRLYQLVVAERKKRE